MLREMGELLDRYTEHKPLLLVTEDLQWSDHATVQLMDHIARRRGGARLMWLASFRLVEIIAADHPLKALRHELRLHGLCEEIVLDPFSEKEVAEYIAERIPAFAVDEAFVRALHARTDGLPLFVVDVINDLIAHGELGAGGESSAWLRLASMAIPENLAGIIDQYIRRLTPEQRALLETASVCGVEFRPGTVADALGRDLAWVVESCDELARRQQWLSDAAVDARGSVLDTRYAFRHALYRQVLYERIGPLARAQFHRKVGASLERDRAAGLAVTAAELASHFERGREPMTALRYYAEAAESALRHFSPAEAMSLTERALALLVQAEAGTARTTLEITLATLQAVSAEHLLGLGSIEAKRAFERAQALLDDVPRHPMSGLLLRGLGMVHVMRGEYSEALALAERCAALSLATKDPILLLCACSVQGNVQTLQGRPRIAREWLERGVVASDALGEATLEAAFVTDPGVMLLAMFSVPLLYLGFVDQARARLRAAHARARHLAQPMAQTAAIWFDALFEVRMRNAQCVRDLAEQMRAIVDDSALAQARAAHRWFRGWAQAQLGDPREGYRLIREGYEENVRLGMLSGASEVLGYAAEALVLAGDWSAARQQLDEAMQTADTLGERVYLPQLLLLEARIADTRREPARAREWIRQALAEARAQEARWLELTALLALCEREDATAEDVQALASLIDQLTEGLDTAPVARARVLLGAARAA
jgi:tetratricopeptide (TPR) repeat protein